MLVAPLLAFELVVSVSAVQHIVAIATVQAVIAFVAVHLVSAQQAVHVAGAIAPVQGRVVVISAAHFISHVIVRVGHGHVGHAQAHAAAHAVVVQIVGFDAGADRIGDVAVGCTVVHTFDGHGLRSVPVARGEDQGLGRFACSKYTLTLVVDGQGQHHIVSWRLGEHHAIAGAVPSLCRSQVTRVAKAHTRG